MPLTSFIDRAKWNKKLGKVFMHVVMFNYSTIHFSFLFLMNCGWMHCPGIFSATFRPGLPCLQNCERTSVFLAYSKQNLGTPGVTCYQCSSYELVKTFWKATKRFGRATQNVLEGLVHYPALSFRS